MIVNGTNVPSFEINGRDVTTYKRISETFNISHQNLMGRFKKDGIRAYAKGYFLIRRGPILDYLIEIGECEAQANRMSLFTEVGVRQILRLNR